MRPILPPPPAGSSSFSSSSSSSPSYWSSASANRRGQRRRPDLTLPIPQRDPALAVPLPLPPATTCSGPSTNHQSQNQNHKRHQLINPAELERGDRIGSGCGGTVWRVFHRATSSVFALKVIYGNHEGSVRSQICREIEILRDVDHPNVVKCHDIYDRNGEIGVLLEYMDGGSLEGAHIKQEHILSDLARQVLGALAYLHKRHIVHRGIKPSNLLKNSRKNVKIADFGVGRILAQTMDPCHSAVGTIAYMSPERMDTDLNNGRYDGYAGDIWSLGVCLLEFYLGRFPFAVGRQGDWASLMCTICLAQPPEAPATASREFRDFISWCLQKDPRRRWTAAQLLQHPFILRAGQSQVDLEGIFVIANFVLELPSAVFDQLSSVRKPQFALLGMLMSFAALFICIVELVHKCRKEKVTWKWRGTLPWLYLPRRNKPFGSFKDIIGLVCAICQCVVTTITYNFCLRQTDNPIKISVWPIIFAFGLLCSKFLGNGQRGSTER